MLKSNRTSYLPIYFLITLLVPNVTVAQTLPQKIATAYRTFESHESLRNGIASFTVLNARTGEIVFAKNEQIGLSPASTLKTITSATAYHILGADHRFETELFYSGTIDGNGTLHGDIIIKGSGDPTLGSDRFSETHEDVILAKWVDAINHLGIRHIEGSVIADDELYNGQSAPHGWTWQDMGNYYGSGVSALNWRENAFGVNFSTGKNVGDPTTLLRTSSDVSYLQLINETTTGKAGTGDNVYAFAAPYSSRLYFRGTHGIDLKKSIYVSIPDGAYDAAYNLHHALIRKGLTVSQAPTTTHQIKLSGLPLPQNPASLSKHSSPILGSIVYHFNQKSVNLYGEALLKAISQKQLHISDTREATDFVRNFWSQKLGIPKGELRIMDGSGLSPENRITTHALARILASLKTEIWYESFYASLPTYNAMKMKSGTIGGVLGYAGYHTASDGTPLVFAVLANNYQGTAQPMRNRMFKLLDSLK